MKERFKQVTEGIGSQTLQKVRKVIMSELTMLKGKREVYWTK